MNSLFVFVSHVLAQQPNLIPLVALVAIVPIIIIGLVLWKLYAGYSWSM